MAFDIVLTLLVTASLPPLCRGLEATCASSDGSAAGGVALLQRGGQASGRCPSGSSTGSTWLRFLLAAVSRGSDSGCAPPFCAIYPDGRRPPCKVDRAWCNCEWNQSQGARLVKTHWPQGELFRGAPLTENEQHRDSMYFDKLVRLVRHPVSTVRSNIRRWGGQPATVSQNLRCWTEHWDRVAAQLDAGKVHFLSYERMCVNTSHEIHKVLQFLRGCYASISLASVERAILAHSDLKCKHRKDLAHVVGPDYQTIMHTVGSLDIYSDYVEGGWSQRFVA